MPLKKIGSENKTQPCFHDKKHTEFDMEGKIRRDTWFRTILFPPMPNLFQLG